MNQNYIPQTTSSTDPKTRYLQNMFSSFRDEICEWSRPPHYTFISSTLSNACLRTRVMVSDTRHALLIPHKFKAAATSFICVIYRQMNIHWDVFSGRISIVFVIGGGGILYTSLRYINFNWLTPWSRVLLAKLTVSQSLKKFSPFYGTRKFTTVFTRVRDASSSHLPTQFHQDPC
jgi:hypothetical protein